MKKPLLYIAIATILALSACTEKGPPIDFSNVVKIDTTYITTIETPELRRVLVEQATGVKCPNCPAGAALLKQAEDANPGRVILVGLHALSLTSPILGESKYNFQSIFAETLFLSYFGGEPNKPASVFDRTIQGSGYFVENRNTWLNTIAQRLQTVSPVNLSITVTGFDAVNNETVIKVRAAYTSTIAKKQSLSIMITEDKIIDAQEDGTNIIEDYEHNHVLRDMLTPAIGNNILDDVSPKEAGRVYERTFTYKVPDGNDWNVDNLNIIAFIHNNEAGDKEVQQAVEIKLKP